jgi:NADPH-dependent ferric siderophore reductase
VGTALVEAPSDADALEFPHPPGMDVQWLVRESGVPGTRALAALATIPLPGPHVHAFVVGEQALATGGRRALVERGVPKDAISFVGYWRVGSPVSRSAAGTAQ